MRKVCLSSRIKMCDPYIDDNPGNSDMSWLYVASSEFRSHNHDFYTSLRLHLKLAEQSFGYIVLQDNRCTGKHTKLWQIS